MCLGLAAPFIRTPVVCAQSPDDQAAQSALDRAAAMLQSDHPRSALDALVPVEALEPLNPWLWYYRGLAHTRLRNAYVAIGCFDRALDRLAELGDPDPDLASSARHCRHRARQQILRVSARAGLAYDTNVSFLGDVATGLGLVSGQPDGRFGSSAEIRYAPIVTEDHELSVAARLGHTWHFEIDDFDTQDYGGAIRYAHWFGERWEASIQYDYDYTLLGNDAFLSNHAVTPSIQYHWPTSAEGASLDKTGVYYQFNGRDFLFATEPGFDRDGVANGVGAEQSFEFQPLPGTTRKGDLTLGYRYDSISTEGTEFDRNTHNFYVGVGLPLLNPRAPDRYLILPDKELIFRFGVSWEIADYRERSLIDDWSRHRGDVTTTYGFSVSQKLVEDPDHGDLTLHGIVHWTDAESSLTANRGMEPYTYDKVVYGVQLEWSW